MAYRDLWVPGTNPLVMPVSYNDARRMSRAAALRLFPLHAADISQTSRSSRGGVLLQWGVLPKKYKLHGLGVNHVLKYMWEIMTLNSDL